MLFLCFESLQPVALFSYFFCTHYSTHGGLLCVYNTLGKVHSSAMLISRCTLSCSTHRNTPESLVNRMNMPCYNQN